MNVILTAMGGMLLRTEEGWRWRDHRPEPRVRDITAWEAFQYPRVIVRDPSAPEGRAVYVSIPEAALAEESELREVLAEADDRVRRTDEEPGVVQVPLDVWEPWARAMVIGVAWDAADEDELLGTAERLRALRG